MKITKNRLKEMIKEEIGYALEENIPTASGDEKCDVDDLWFPLDGLIWAMELLLTGGARPYQRPRPGLEGKWDILHPDNRHDVDSTGLDCVAPGNEGVRANARKALTSLKKLEALLAAHAK